MNQFEYAQSRGGVIYYPHDNCHEQNPVLGGYGFCSLQTGHDGPHKAYGGHMIVEGNRFSTWGPPLIEEDPL